MSVSCGNANFKEFHKKYFFTDTGASRSAILMLCSMPSKISIATTMAILTTCSTELVSPEKRRMCAFSTLLYGRIFLLLLPFVMFTKLDMFGPLSAQLVITSMNILASFFLLLITGPRTFPVKDKLDNSEVLSVTKNTL